MPGLDKAQRLADKREEEAEELKEAALLQPKFPHPMVAFDPVFFGVFDDNEEL